MITTEWFMGGENLTDAHAIRRAVFIEEQGIAEEIEMDGTDSACVHLVAYDDDNAPAATGRIMVTLDSYIIGRVAVLPKYRRQQFGTLIMQTLVHTSYSMGGERQEVHAQAAVRKFYERLGFIAYGEEYLEAGIPHIKMSHEGDSEQLCKKCK